MRIFDRDVGINSNLLLSSIFNLSLNILIKCYGGPTEASESCNLIPINGQLIYK